MSLRLLLQDIDRLAMMTGRRVCLRRSSWFELFDEAIFNGTLVNKTLVNEAPVNGDTPD